MISGVRARLRGTFSSDTPKPNDPGKPGNPKAEDAPPVEETEEERKAREEREAEEERKRKEEEEGTPSAEDAPADETEEERKAREEREAEEERKRKEEGGESASAPAARIQAILTSAAGRANPAQAEHLAFSCPTVSAKDAIAILGKAAPAKADPAADAKGFHKAMLNTGNSKVGAASEPGPEAGSEAALVASTVALARRMNLAR